MKEQRYYLEKAKRFVKRHKTKIIVGSAVVVTGILVAKNWEFIIDCFSTDLLPNSTGLKDIFSIPATDIIHNVVSDVPARNNLIQFPLSIRNLPEGWNSSAEKLALAEEIGIDLLPQQTWVVPFTKNCA